MIGRFSISRQIVRRISGALALLACLSLPWVWSASMEQVPRATVLEQVGGLNQRMSRDGSTLIEYYECSGPITVWDLKSRKSSNRMKADEHRRKIALSNDGSKLALLMEDGRVQVVESATGKQITVLQGGQPFPLPPPNPFGDFFSFNGDATIVVAITHAGLLTTWELSTGRMTHSFKVRAVQPAWFELSPDSSTLVRLTSDSPNPIGFQLYELPSGRLRVERFVSSLRGVDFSPDSGTLALASDDEIMMLDVRTGQVITHYHYPDAILSLTYCLDGNTVCVTFNHQDPRSVALPRWMPSTFRAIADWFYHDYEGLDLVDVSTGKCKARLRFNDPTRIGCVALLADEKSLALLVDQSVQIWDIPPRTRLPSYSGWLWTALAFGLCFHWFYSGGPQALLYFVALKPKQRSRSEWLAFGVKRGALAGILLGLFLGTLLVAVFYFQEMNMGTAPWAYALGCFTGLLGIAVIGGTATGLMMGFVASLIQRLVRLFTTETSRDYPASRVP